MLALLASFYITGTYPGQSKSWKAGGNRTASLPGELYIELQTLAKGLHRTLEQLAKKKPQIKTGLLSSRGQPKHRLLGSSIHSAARGESALVREAPLEISRNLALVF